MVAAFNALMIGLAVLVLGQQFGTPGLGPLEFRLQNATSVRVPRALIVDVDFLAALPVATGAEGAGDLTAVPAITLTLPSICLQFLVFATAWSLVYSLLPQR